MLNVFVDTTYIPNNNSKLSFRTIYCIMLLLLYYEFVPESDAASSGSEEMDVPALAAHFNPNQRNSQRSLLQDMNGTEKK